MPFRGDVRVCCALILINVISAVVIRKRGRQVFGITAWPSTTYDAGLSEYVWPALQPYKCEIGEFENKGARMVDSIWVRSFQGTVKYVMNQDHLKNSDFKLVEFEDNEIPKIFFYGHGNEDVFDFGWSVCQEAPDLNEKNYIQETKDRWVEKWKKECGSGKLHADSSLDDYGYDEMRCGKSANPGKLSVDEAVQNFWEFFRIKDKGPLLSFELTLVSCCSGKGLNSMVRQFARQWLHLLIEGIKSGDVDPELSFDVKFMAPDEVISVVPVNEGGGVFHMVNQQTGEKCFDMKTFEFNIFEAGVAQSTTTWRNQGILSKQSSIKQLSQHSRVPIKSLTDLCTFFVNSFPEVCLEENTGYENIEKMKNSYKKNCDCPVDAVAKSLWTGEENK